MGQSRDTQHLTELIKRMETRVSDLKTELEATLDAMASMNNTSNHKRMSPKWFKTWLETLSTWKGECWEPSHIRLMASPSLLSRM